MFTIRKAKERGHFNHGWLDTYHTFSFADYHDLQHMGFRQLRVINEDTVQAGQGFGTHPHQDMEILTYVTQGALSHKDSMGNGSTISVGDVQRMSAGTGITHSEFNHSKRESVHLLQIWIRPNQKGLSPSYEQKHFSDKEKTGKLLLVASRDGRNNSVTIHQDVDLYSTVLTEKKEIVYPIRKNRSLWIQVVRGKLIVDTLTLETGDGLAIEKESTIKISGNNSEILLFDLT